MRASHGAGLPLLRGLVAFLGVLLTAACVVALAACGGEPATGEAPPAPSPTATTQSPPPPPSTPTPTRTARPTPRPSPTKAAATKRTALRVVFVDVGQGDAILVVSGNREMLVDGGPSGAVWAVERAMDAAGVRDLDVVVASHMHADHIGATPALVEHYRPGLALVAGSVQGTLRWSFREAHAEVRKVRRGDGLRLGTARVRVLSPGSVSGDANADSVVLLVEANGRRVLLTGDCTGPNEEAVAAICSRGPPVDVLKVAHHGSRYSTGSWFLSQVRPRTAVICVGRNSYGHPTPETVKRLRAAGARVYTTQRNGTITVTVAPSGKLTWRFTKSSKPLTRVAGSRTDGGTAATAAGGSNPTVYITATGECYHRAGCRYLAKSCIPIRLKDAKAQGYRPCSVCDPPR